METYKILRFSPDCRPKVIATGLCFEEAQEHCSKEYTHKKDRDGNILWFDGYTKE